MEEGEAEEAEWMGCSGVMVSSFMIVGLSGCKKVGPMVMEDVGPSGKEWVQVSGDRCGSR